MIKGVHHTHTKETIIIITEEDLEEVILILMILSRIQDTKIGLEKFLIMVIYDKV